MSELENQVAKFRELHDKLSEGLSHVVIGQQEIVRGTLTALFAGSHVLLEGVPGLGKTLLVRALSEILGLPHSRIQFTPDLMPADIIGTTAIEQEESGSHRFEFRKGPLFSSVVLADEINRATPKTQSALLEAMQEHSISVGGQTMVLGEPYIVLATQNPLEMEGTYPLPEAQLDRFLFKLRVPYPSAEVLSQILTTPIDEREKALKPLTDRDELVTLQCLIKDAPVPASVVDYVVRLVRSTHPELDESSAAVKKFIVAGSSPRGAQALLAGAKIHALVEGRVAAAIEDVKEVAEPALRHRLIRNFEGEADNIDVDGLIRELCEAAEN